jgi:hypothetical protein
MNCVLPARSAGRGERKNCVFRAERKETADELPCLQDYSVSIPNCRDEQESQIPEVRLGTTCMPLWLMWL